MIHQLTNLIQNNFIHQKFRINHFYAGFDFYQLCYELIHLFQRKYLWFVGAGDVCLNVI